MAIDVDRTLADDDGDDGADGDTVRYHDSVVSDSDGY